MIEQPGSLGEILILVRDAEGRINHALPDILKSIRIELIHDAVKYELIQQGVNPDSIFPHFQRTNPEIKLAGFLKQKDQDICVVPSGIPKQKIVIDWGPMAFLKKIDPYGFEYSTRICSHY